ncbi:MAG TPA: GDP-L-fucose synthase [Steroidobacteraceae bacterium]|nr:GDP-L-fucose synthase [Steroidobacteraceae bacterium]
MSVTTRPFSRHDIIYVAGHRGLAGSAIYRALKRAGYTNVIGETHRRLDLTQARAVDRYFDEARPKVVILAAARVGGIVANVESPADFIRDNLLIQTSVIDAAYRHGVSKLVFLGSSCIYPKLAAQPMREEYLLTGALESTNDAYAIAKLAGIKMCQAYRSQYGFDAVSVLPTNLYGPHDNFSERGSHVIPGLIRRMHDAKQSGAREFTVWGSGTPRREFLHADDFATAVLTVMERYAGDGPINIGSGEDLTIAELANTLRDVTGLAADLKFDPAKPDGTPRKLLEVSRIRELGWQPKIGLEEGLAGTYRWFCEHHLAPTGNWPRLPVVNRPEISLS